MLHLTAVCHLDGKIISPFQIHERAGTGYMDTLKAVRMYRVVFTPSIAP